jgi:hypothetical protein
MRPKIRVATRKNDQLTKTIRVAEQKNRTSAGSAAVRGFREVPLD